jgi:hypothetical protein
MPSTLILTVIIIILSLGSFKLWSNWRTAERADYIRTYMFPKGLLDKFATIHPELSLKENQLVARALRQFFLAHLKSGRKFVSMPSQAADDLWHEFILYTRHYESFCNKAFGKFMHHTPAVVLSSNKQDNTGLRRTWWYCCLEENINPKSPTRLPLLFSLDEKFNISNGFRYALDCQGIRRDNTSNSGNIYCGGDMSSSSYDGTTEGFGDTSYGSSDTASTDSGGDSSGCSGGCGGGD